MRVFSLKKAVDEIIIGRIKFAAFRDELIKWFPMCQSDPKWMQLNYKEKFGEDAPSLMFFRSESRQLGRISAETGSLEAENSQDDGCGIVIEAPPLWMGDINPHTHGWGLYCNAVTVQFIVLNTQPVNASLQRNEEVRNRNVLLTHNNKASLRTAFRGLRRIWEKASENLFWSMSKWKSESQGGHE